MTFIIDEELLAQAGNIRVLYAETPRGEGFQLEWSNAPLGGSAGCEGCSC